MEKQYEIVVVGGGLAGTFAAVTAARMGHKVLLLEKTGCLGGTLTGCGVGPMMTGHTGERQVIGGLFEELTERMKREGYSCGHVRDTTGYVSYLTPFSAEGMKWVLDEMAAEAGVDVLFHVMVGAAQRNNRKIERIQVCGCEGLFPVCGDVFVDATGDGDLAYFAGAPMETGRNGDGQSQPMTMNAKYCGVNREKLLAYILDNIEHFPRLVGKESLLKQSGHLAIAGFARELERARLTGEVQFEREEVLMFETDKRGEFIVNTTRVTGEDGRTSESVSRAERKGRDQCRELDIFLRKYVPGFENALLEFTGPAIGIRDSRRLCGAYTLSAADVIQGKLFDTRIALASYPIDIHNPDGAGTDSIFKMGENGYYSVPYEVMFCREIDNLLVTGRCVSATFEAQAAIRTTPTTSAMGQAAGTAAAISLELEGRKKGQVGAVNRERLQGELKKSGAIL